MESRSQSPRDEKQIAISDLISEYQKMNNKTYQEISELIGMSSKRFQDLKKGNLNNIKCFEVINIKHMLKLNTLDRFI